MPSDSDDESMSLKDRLRAKLSKAGLPSRNDESATLKKSQQPTISVNLPASNNQLVVSKSLESKKNVNHIAKQTPVAVSSDSEDECAVVKRKSRAMEISSSDSVEHSDDDLTSVSRQLTRKFRQNVLSSSSDDDETSDSQFGNSSDESDNDSLKNSHGGLIDDEAEEVSGTESGTTDEEGDGDIVSSSESDWESDWASGNEEHFVEIPSTIKEVHGVKRQPASSGFSSDSSDGSSEKCPICLLRFSDQEIGTPESCDHSFCAECLQQWSKNVNTCPVDRQEFTLILVRRRVGGKVIGRLPVERHQLQEEETVDDLTYCEICGHADREDWMLLCDGCDLGFHTDCLDPPLDHVPIEDWFCPECAQNNGAVEGGVPTDAGSVEIPSRRPRLLPRTRQYERFHRAMHNVIEQRRMENFSQPSTSSGIDSHQSVEPRAKRRKITKKRTASQRKKRKSKSKRKPTKASKKASKKPSKKRNTSSMKTTGKKRKAKKLSSSKVKRKKRSSRRSAQTVRVVPRQSVKGRLAEQLGMRPPRQPWQTMPDVKASANKTGIGLDRSRAGIPTLYIFGQRDQLDYFSGSDEEVGNGGGMAVVHQSRSALTLEQRMHNRKRLLVSLSRPCIPRRPDMCEPVSTETSVDLVGSILQSQTKMLSKKTDVKINIDGSLDIKLRDPELRPDDNRSLLNNPGGPNTNVQSLPDSASEHIVQAPMYSGGGNRRGGPEMHHNSYRGNSSGGMRGRGGTTNSGGGGSNVNNSGFRSSFNNPENSRAQYAQYLGNNVHSGHPSRRPRPLSFRLNVTRRPLRRNAILRRGILPVGDEEEEGAEEEVEVGSQSMPKDDEDAAEGPKEDEDVDIYSDIEADSRKGASEADDEPSFGALLPPPEPPAILMNLGEQNSDDEGSDSELVIDDRAKGPDTEDKYDPAEPCDDSDDEARGLVPQAEEIPLPPGPAPIKSPPPIPVVEYSDDSQSQEPTEEECRNEDLVSSTSTGVETNCDSGNANKDEFDHEPGEQRPGAAVKADATADDSSEDEEEDDDCPNFSIYSATSVSIARQVGDIDLEKGNEKMGLCVEATNISATDTDKADIDSSSKDVDQDSRDDAVLIEESHKKTPEEGLLEVDIENSEKKALEDSAKDKDESEDSIKEKDDSEEKEESEESESDDVDDRQKGQEQMLEEIFGLDDDSLVAAPLAMPLAPVVPGLEGLETEIISDGEEAMLDGDLSDPETVPDDKRFKKRPCRTSGEKDKASDPADFEDGEIVDEAQRERRERKEREKREKQKTSEGDENVDILKSKESSDDDKRKKRRRELSPKDRAPLSSSENRTKERDKEKSRDKEKDKKRSNETDKEKSKTKEDISWKKPSKSTKDRNYRDGKEKGKDEKRDGDKEVLRKERKKKEKRKDLERYDVRKVLSDKTLSRQNKDAFGRDIDIRRRSRTRSRSKSRTRSRSRARSARGRSRSRSHRRAARSRTKSRGRSPGKSKVRHRSASAGRPKTRRSRSRIRSGNRSRSRHRSVARSRDRHKKSRSKDRGRKRSRDQKNDSANKPRARSTTASRERRREGREREQPRPRNSWSRSWSRSWSPSLSASPQYPASETLAARSFSRSWSRDRVDHVSTTDMVGGKHKTHKNLTVIVTNNKEESRRKRKEGRRGNKRRASPAPSKEVFASGDNILVSVNFKSGAQASNTSAGEKSSKRKRDEGRSKRSKKDKSSKSSKSDAQPSETAKPPEKRRKAPPPEASQKPVAIIDLEQSPYREYTPSPKDLIVLSDSEEDSTQPNEQELQQLKQLLHEEINTVTDEQAVSTGPKTPPEPQIKFSISTKSAIRSMNNPLMDEEEEEEEEEKVNETGNECTGTEMEVLHKGPNTPPESPMGPATPGSSPTSPDAYDPFEPTKSRSASPDEGAGISERPPMDVESVEQPHENGAVGAEVEDEARPKSDATDDVLVSPKKGEGENVSPGTTAPEADESEKSKPMSPSSSAEAAAVKTPSKIVAAAGGSTEVTSSTSSLSNRAGQQRSVTQSDRLLGTVIKGISTIRPAPKATTPSKSVPRQNGESSAQTDVIDMDLDSPYSPASSEGDDLFEPPPVYSLKPPQKTTPRPKPAAGGSSKSEKFDILFGSSPLQRVKYNSNARVKSSGKNAGRNQAKLNKIVKQMAKMRKDGPGGKAEEDQIKILDEVPSSAVEMQVKDKFLKKLNRQERVVEEVKLALKPHYYKKHINKDDYKEILRRSVPKICHNKSGEINPIKIRTLVEAYVKKIRYLKKKASSASGQLKPKGMKKQGD